MAARSHRDRVPGTGGGAVPSAKRALLVEWGAWGDRETADAILMALGQIDYYLLKPWRSPDELFHRTLSEFIHEWAQAGSFGPRGRRDRRAVVSAGAQLRTLLSQNGVPHVFHSHDSEQGRSLLAEAGRDAVSGPVVMLRGGQVLEAPRTPSSRRRGSTPSPTSTASSTFSSSARPGRAGRRGVRLLRGARDARDRARVDRRQAGSSSRIHNYLGFSRESAAPSSASALQQAWVLGTEFVHMREVTRLRTEPTRHVVSVADGSGVAARGVVLATGVTYRRIEVPSLLALAGKGVFYGTSNSEVRALRGHHVHVVGGGNSAGQAAMQPPVREPCDARGPRAGSVAVHVALPAPRGRGGGQRRRPPRLRGHRPSGEGRLERLTVRDNSTGATEELETAAMFVLIGARPHTE